MDKVTETDIKGLILLLLLFFSFMIFIEYMSVHVSAETQGG